MKLYRNLFRHKRHESIKALRWALCIILSEVRNSDVTGSFPNFNQDTECCNNSLPVTKKIPDRVISQIPSNRWTSREKRCDIACHTVTLHVLTTLQSLWLYYGINQNSQHTGSKSDCNFYFCLLPSGWWKELLTQSYLLFASTWINYPRTIVYCQPIATICQQIFYLTKNNSKKKIKTLPFKCNTVWNDAIRYNFWISSNYTHLLMDRKVQRQNYLKEGKTKW